MGNMKIENLRISVGKQKKIYISMGNKKKSMDISMGKQKKIYGYLRETKENLRIYIYGKQRKIYEYLWGNNRKSTDIYGKQENLCFGETK